MVYEANSQSKDRVWQTILMEHLKHLGLLSERKPSKIGNFFGSSARAKLSIWLALFDFVANEFSGRIGRQKREKPKTRNKIQSKTKQKAKYRGGGPYSSSSPLSSFFPSSPALFCLTSIDEWNLVNLGSHWWPTY